MYTHYQCPLVPHVSDLESQSGLLTRFAVRTWRYWRSVLLSFHSRRLMKPVKVGWKSVPAFCMLLWVLLCIKSLFFRSTSANGRVVAGHAATHLTTQRSSKIRFTSEMRHCCFWTRITQPSMFSNCVCFLDLRIFPHCVLGWVRQILATVKWWSWLELTRVIIQFQNAGCKKKTTWKTVRSVWLLAPINAFLTIRLHWTMRLNRAAACTQHTHPGSFLSQLLFSPRWTWNEFVCVLGSHRDLNCIAVIVFYFPVMSSFGALLLCWEKIKPLSLLLWWSAFYWKQRTTTRQQWTNGDKLKKTLELILARSTTVTNCCER